ncbi:retrovirus-related pol polyprotein from transposon TNT 1-94 [Tanacetum coccineum]
MSSTIIGTKWVYRNKLDENGIVSQHKARLVAQGYNQQEGIDYNETYAPVARLESIRILLAYACALDFKLFQMDVKSAFLNGFINEEVYVAQPSGFIDFEKPDHVYKLKKALYGLKQAPKAWYDRLKAFLIKHEYKMGMVDNTLFTKKKSSNLIIVQIYVDDIIFSSTCQDMCDDFAKIMHDEFEMSMMGELNFFLGLQIKQMEDGIFFNQSKYIKEMLKKFGLEDSKPMKTPMSSDTKLTKDEECESVDSTKYRGMIGSLLYLTASRPDIMFSVCLCARFQEDPKTSHLEAVKRIFRYIKGTTHLGLCLHTAVNMWIRNLVIRNRVGDLQLGIESYQTKINLERPNWDAADYYFKEDYTIVPKPRAVVYRDRNDQRKLMRLNELHKFSDGTLTRVMEKLDHMVKDFHLFEYNKGMETRKWSEDDKRRSKDFITAIEKRLQIRRIYRSLESFVGGRIRDIDYRLINRTT